MSTLPFGDDVVTRSHLRAELAVVENRLTLRMGALGLALATVMVALQLFA